MTAAAGDYVAGGVVGLIGVAAIILCADWSEIVARITAARHRAQLRRDREAGQGMWAITRPGDVPLPEYQTEPLPADIEWSEPRGMHVDREEVAPPESFTIEMYPGTFGIPPRRGVGTHAH